MSSHVRRADWRTSSRCGPSGQCVEIAGLDAETIGVRDGGRAGETEEFLAFGAAEWARFTGRVKRGGADLPR